MKKVYFIILAVVIICATILIAVTNKNSNYPLISTEQSVALILSKKYNIPLEDLVIKVEKDTGMHAKGLVNYKTVLGGGIWLAVKQGTDWKVVFDGNGIVSCEIANNYNFSPELLPGCIDHNNGDIFVQRTNTSNMEPEVEKYINQKFEVTFMYPKKWFGPEIEENNDGFRFEIGTDTDYPYGTGLDQRTNTKENSYYIVVQYYNTTNSGNGKLPTEFTKIANLKNEETLEDLRSKIIKVRYIQMGDLNGIEFVSTLSDSAQTDHVYIREVVLVNSKGNMLKISGTPNNVTVSNPLNWKYDYSIVDKNNLAKFSDLINSVNF